MSLLLALALSAPAQDPPADPQPVAGADRAHLGAVLADPGFVVFDRPESDGEWWVRGTNYKASFAAGAWQFIPRPAPGAAEPDPIRFRLRDVRVGGVSLAVAPGTPQRSGHRISYDHGSGVVQRIDADGGGVEQSFVLSHLPARAAVEVEIAVETAFALRADRDALVFARGDQVVTYSHAVAFDARGERIVAPTTVESGRILLSVPAGFVARAALPLTIDPRVAYAVPSFGSNDHAEPDVCMVRVPLSFPPVSTTVWHVVFASYFGANDWDCFVQQYDENLVARGGLIPIDVTTAGWLRPRIASLAFIPRVLVVAQVRSGSARSSIRARAIRNLDRRETGAPFDVMTDGVDLLNPDVGGDPSGAFRSAFFTVVWQRAFSATDHDVFVRQIDWNDVVQPVIPIQTNGLHQTNPSVSKSCGTFSVGDAQRFVIVYQERTAAGDEDVHGALLTWDGRQVPVNGAGTFPIDVSSHRDLFPQVSSPSLPDSSGTRRMLVVYERATSGGGDVAATCIDHHGAILAAGNVSALENDATRLGWPQSRPSVDSDGLRFHVAYHELYQNNTQVNDFDTRMSLVALAGNALVVQEAGAILSFSGNREFHAQVASAYSGGFFPSERSCAVNDRDNTNGTFGIDARTFDGVPVNTFATRTTGCGTMWMVHSGDTRIGASVTFTLNLSSFARGFFVGQPVSLPLPQCPGCTLGVDGGALFAHQLTLPIPRELNLIGARLSVQGFVLVPSGGPCLGQVHLTDTVDFTVQ